MIHVESLVRRYGSTTAVAGISFDISSGEVVGFLGPNGAGKTTTLKVLAGYLDPSDGKVECRGMIGYLPENNPLYEEMEVSDYLDWAANMRGMGGASKRAALKRAADRCGLSAVIGRDIGELSKGYRQRVGLAAAIIHDPAILLLDEPTSGLDPNQAAEVRELIAELRREKTVLLSTHILSEVRASCDRVIIINKGAIAAQGKLDELAASRGVRLNVVLSGEGRADARAELESLPGALSVAAHAAAGETRYSIELDPSAPDPRERVFRLAVEKRWPVLEAYRERASLEDIFRSLTA